MGRIRRALIRIGSTGSIARWAWKARKHTLTEVPGLSEEEVCEYLWVRRYAVMPPAPGSSMEGRLRAARTPKRLDDLCMWVVFVEMNVDPSDGELFEDVQVVINSELERLAQRDGTS